jgi:hypothetical protein
MARGNNPGKDFDDQYHASRREGQRKAARGEGAWADDKYLRDMRAGGEDNSGSGGNKDNSGCGKDTLLILGFLSGFGWVISEVVSRAL